MRPHPIIGVDHEPGGGVRTQCRDHHERAFPFCYDEHEGSDLILEGGFVTMDAGSARVVAAAAGRVTRVEDGHYDRCHADLLSADVTCDGRPVVANRVHLAHAGGWETRYLHLRAGSVRVRVGQEVACGEALALVGSSGYSSAPHLHFELRDDLGRVRDPFAGPASQPYSLWVDEAPAGAPPATATTSALPAARCAP
ncbi:MAG: M23 family metallopeptidase [Deltaproteobacteria bacterium]|nr:M23 family metallopeptidase [Deltaproteobacteria bacterium]